jgi:hypothetical protein
MLNFRFHTRLIIFDVLNFQGSFTSPTKPILNPPHTLTPPEGIRTEWPTPRTEWPTPTVPSLVPGKWVAPGTPTISTVVPSPYSNINKFTPLSNGGSLPSSGNLSSRNALTPRTPRSPQISNKIPSMMNVQVPKIDKKVLNSETSTVTGIAGIPKLNPVDLPSSKNYTSSPLVSSPRTQLSVGASEPSASPRSPPIPETADSVSSSKSSRIENECFGRSSKANRSSKKGKGNINKSTTGNKSTTDNKSTSANDNKSTPVQFWRPYGNVSGDAGAANVMSLQQSKINSNPSPTETDGDHTDQYGPSDVSGPSGHVNVNTADKLLDGFIADNASLVSERSKISGKSGPDSNLVIAPIFDLSRSSRPAAPPSAKTFPGPGPVNTLTAPAIIETPVLANAVALPHLPKGPVLDVSELANPPDAPELSVPDDSSELELVVYNYRDDDDESIRK